MKRIIMDINSQQSRIALTEEGMLKEFYIERQNYKRMVGNIYKGRVENVLPGMQAAFINIGIEKNAFLHVKDASALIEMNEKDGVNWPSINKILKQGQELLVQVIKEPIAQKGARVNTNITLPGRYIVLMPTSDYIGISRRIEQENERDRLRSIAQECKPEKMGVIIRTEAERMEKEEILSDLKFLINLWEKVERKDRMSIAPKLIHSELELPYRIVRDLFTKEIDEFIINNKEYYDRVLEMVELISSNLKDRVIYFDEPNDLFSHYYIDSQIEDMLCNKIWLSCGGYIVIDQTEALTVIDVNTGKFVGSTNLQDTVLKTNLQAAGEIAKQLRLRDIGGIIIIDFIDMKSPQDEIKVLEKLEECFKEDKTRTNVMGITQLGLVEITRKKARKSIGRILQQTCPLCKGTGRVLAMDTFIIYIDDMLRKNPYLKQEENLKILLHPHTAHRFEADKMNVLEQLKEIYKISFEIIKDTTISINEVKIIKE